MSTAILILEEMPNNCVDCPLADRDRIVERCFVTGNEIINTFDESEEELVRNTDCPLISGNNITMCGYNLGQLLIFAEACRKADIKEEDLLAFIRNSESAFHYIYEKMLENIKRNIDKEIIANGK